jgi:capsule polysaccharide export protein KpsE/RkpR
MARNKLRKEKELNQIKKSTNVFFNIIFIISVVYFSNRICVFYLYFE